MLIQKLVPDIDLLCPHCYKVLASVRTQTAYEKEHDTCVYCGKRLLFYLWDLPYYKSP